MSKRPLCTAALVWTLFLWILGQAGFPFLGYAPPKLPQGADREKSLVTGIVYKKEVYERNANLYLKHTNLILNSKKYPIDAIKVSIKKERLKEPVTAGSKIAVLGALREIPTPSNAGQFDERAYYYARKIKWYQEAEKIQMLYRDADKIAKLQEEVREQVGAGIRASFPEHTEGIVEAMLLGEKGNMEQENKFLFQLMGCSHILAVSGMHLSILGGGVYWLLRKLRIPMRAGCVLTVAFIIFYGGLTGNGAAVVRAAVMFITAQGAVWVKRTYDFLSAAALAAILLLTDSPLYLYDSSFLLSFGAVLGLGMVQPLLFSKEKGRGLSRIRRAVTGGIEAGISVWCLLLPLVLYFFFELPLGSVLVNLLVLPTVAVLFLSGMLGGILGMLPMKGLGQAAGLAGALLLEAYLKIGNILRLFPYALWITGRPELWKCGIYYLAVGWLLWQRRERNKNENKKWRLTDFGSAFAVLLSLALLFWKPLDGDMKVTFLDVGQGDCACIQTDSRSCYLVDGGSSSVSKVGKNRILPFLKASGIRRVKGVFVSHMDKDHVNGIFEILEMIKNGEINMEIQTLFLSKCQETEEERRKLEEAGRAAGCEILLIKKGSRITERNLVITCLAPDSETMERNAGSQVLGVSQGKFDVLFTGDVEGEGEQELLQTLEGEGREYELLKTAHHGSKNSTCSEFLAKVKPAAAVISCGRDNRYGHPHRETLERLEAEKTAVFQTPDGGAISVLTEKDYFEISGYVSFHREKIMVK